MAVKVSKETKSTGISFLGMLAILFIGLKLTSYIDWSWWWVLAPLWLPWAFILAVLGVVALVAIIVAIVERR